MPTKAKGRRKLSIGELQHIDAIISLAQESGLKLGDHVLMQSEACCCGAIAAEAHGKFVYTARDREILKQISRLESQVQSPPTLGQLIEARGALLREAKTRG